MAGPSVDGDGVTFRFPDPDGELAAVSVFQEVGWPRPGLDLRRCDGWWEARLDRPAVDRMEYLFDLLHADGGAELVCDPGNPRRAPGPFGAKSVIEFPEYAVPAWVTAPRAPAGTTRRLALGAVVDGMLWSAHGTGPNDPLPLLVVHDGLEYARYSDLLVFLDRMVADGMLPAMRAALLHPTGRDEQYAASPSYADDFTDVVLPAVRDAAPLPPGRRYRVGMGASLGALAMLHAHRMHPAAFGGLFLQSGSFFHHRHFRHHPAFEHTERIRRFTDRVHASRSVDVPIQVTLTCGSVEMNFRNNRALAYALRAQGYPGTFIPVRDAHTWIGWRDAFTPGLVDLLRGLWT